MANSDDFPGGIPRGMKYDDQGNEIELSWAWRRPTDVFWLPFSFAFAVLFIAAAIAEATMMGVAGVALGAIVALLSLRQLVNRNTVRLRPEKLMVSSGPIGRSKGELVGPRDVKQLFVRSVNVRNGIVIYEVHAIVTDLRKDVKVAGNLRTLEQAIFMERRIEQFLEITDAEVPGSISRQTGKPIPRPPNPHLQPPLRNARDELRDAIQFAPIIDPTEMPIINPDED